MFMRSISPIVLAAIMSSLLFLTIGCDSEREPTQSAESRTASCTPTAKANCDRGSRDELLIAGNAMFTAYLEHCAVDMVDVTMDIVSRKMTMSLNAFYGDHEAVRRILTMQFYEEGTEKIGYTSTLTDPHGRLKWEFDFAVNAVEGDDIWITERTEVDCMSIEQSSSNGSFSERYTINGNSRRFSFGTSDVSRIRLLHQQVRSGDIQAVAARSITSTSVDSEILRTLGEFEEFYEADNTLHDNPDGFLVADLLTSTSVATWIEHEFPSELEPEGSFTRWDKFCEAVAICAAIKCPMGANPACGPCAAATLTCAVMDFLGLWS